MRCMVTGHRPNKLGGYNKNHELNQAVIRTLRSRLEGLQTAYGDALTVCSGMALGVDQWWAELATELDIPWIAFVPCKWQESKWPQASQEHYRWLINQATDVVFVSNEVYHPGCMQKRNEAMVNWAIEEGEDTDGFALCVAIWNGTPGGTTNCIRYARLEGLSVEILNPAHFLQR